MEWTNMMNVLTSYHDDRIITVFWANGLILEGVVDTISESCNCLDEDDPDYLEYYMGVLKITNIVQLPKEGVLKEKVGDLIELSIVNEPIKIEEKGGSIVWQLSAEDTSAAPASDKVAD